MGAYEGSDALHGYRLLAEGFVAGRHHLVRNRVDAGLLHALLAGLGIFTTPQRTVAVLGEKRTDGLVGNGERKPTNRSGRDTNEVALVVIERTARVSTHDYGGKLDERNRRIIRPKNAKGAIGGRHDPCGDAGIENHKWIPNGVHLVTAIHIHALRQDTRFDGVGELLGANLHQSEVAPLLVSHDNRLVFGLTDTAVVLVVPLLDSDITVFQHLDLLHGAVFADHFLLAGRNVVRHAMVVRQQQAMLDADEGG